MLGHDIGHELGHVIPGDALVHLLNVVRVVCKAGVVQSLVRHHGLIVGPEGSVGDINWVFVFFNIRREERAGQHDCEVGPADGIGRPERAVVVAVDDAFSGAPDNRVVERVRTGYVGKAQSRSKNVVNGVLAFCIIANRTVGVDVRVILDGEGRDGQGQCHNNRKNCRNKTADVVMGAHIRLFHVCVLSQISFSHGKVSGRVRGTVNRPPSCFAGGRIWGYAGNLP